MHKKVLKTWNWSKVKKNQYFLLGCFFLSLQVLVFWVNFQAQRYEVFFWFCNHAPLFFSIGFFFKKFDIIKALINVGFLGQIFWTLDFVFKLFFDFYLFGITDYIFEDPNGVLVLIPILVHVAATNIALFFTYKKKPTMHVFLLSVIYVIFLYGVSLTYTLEGKNVNCVYENCIGFLNFSFYTYFWPVLVTFLVVLPTHLLQILIYRKYSRKKK
ncbi:MAG: hypothetical protein ACOCXG_03780 [Nanoarchaeota archaeon]